MAHIVEIQGPNGPALFNLDKLIFASRAVGPEGLGNTVVISDIGEMAVPIPYTVLADAALPDRRPRPLGLAAWSPERPV